MPWYVANADTIVIYTPVDVLVNTIEAYRLHTWLHTWFPENRLPAYPCFQRCNHSAIHVHREIVATVVPSPHAPFGRSPLYFLPLMIARTPSSQTNFALEFP